MDNRVSELKLVVCSGVVLVLVLVLMLVMLLLLEMVVGARWK